MVELLESPKLSSLKIGLEGPNESLLREEFNEKRFSPVAELVLIRVKENRFIRSFKDPLVAEELPEASEDRDVIEGRCESSADAGTVFRVSDS